MLTHVDTSQKIYVVQVGTFATNLFSNLLNDIAINEWKIIQFYICILYTAECYFIYLNFVAKAKQV